MKKTLKIMIELFFIFFFVISFSGVSYLTNLYIKSKEANIATPLSNKITTILDKNGNSILQLELTKNNTIHFSDLPDVFINALISGEDARFFSHQGVDFQRIISALITNATKGTIQGASTLTQQLIKNTLLDSSKTLDRKLNEIILSLKLENKLTKEEILEAYCNNIMFDGVTLGVNNASLKFFGKTINHVNIAEAALLAGIVNAPSLYNPIRNPLNAKKRMDTILNLMYRHGYINETELEIAKNAQISDMLVNSIKDETTYPYQAYLDIVYQEVKELTSLSPYSTPLIIETYLDINIQKTIDEIQKGNLVDFYDDNQQFALALIDNSSGALVASLGGRNYNGQLLFNRASEMKNQPASTIKPLLSYALGIEYLDYNSKQVLQDKEYSYPNGQIVNNVDHKYMGELLIEDAIGYSRNTTALSTLEEVVNKVGLNTVTNYLESINLLDVNKNEFSLPYALGAYKYGISPLNLASAYSMIANKGNYQKGYTIKRIKNALTNEVIYTHKNEHKTVLSKSTTDILTSILENVVNNNYYGLGSLKIKDTPLYLKSGTSSFDTNLAKELGYPTNASKDLWIAGFSNQYSFAIWTGFDYPLKGEKNYFNSGSDKRKNTHKQILSKVLTTALTEKGEVKLTKDVTPVYIVKGTNLLPDLYTPSNMIVKAYYKKGSEPKEYISPKPLKNIDNLDIYFSDDLMEIALFNQIILDITKEEKTIYNTQNIYGDIEYIFEVNGDRYISSSPSIVIDIPLAYFIEIKVYSRYSKAIDITSKPYSQIITTY